MDEQVSFHITNGLRLRGVDVVTVQDEGRLGEPDQAVLAHAEELGRVVFTRDDDFTAIASLLQEQGITFVGVFYSHPLHLSIGDCVRELEIIAKCSDVEDWQDRLTFLPI